MFNNQSIAFWDDANNKARFYGLGYLITNPRDPYDMDFFDDPNSEPYKIVTEEGNAYFNFLSSLTSASMFFHLSVCTRHGK